MTTWTNVFATQLRDYLASPSGKALIEGIRDTADNQISNGSSFEDVALTAKSADGMRYILRYIQTMAEFRSKPQAETEFVNVNI